MIFGWGDTLDKYSWHKGWHFQLTNSLWNHDDDKINILSFKRMMPGLPEL